MKFQQVLFRSLQLWSLLISSVLVGFELGLQVAALWAFLVFDLFRVIASLSVTEASVKVSADYFLVACSYSTRNNYPLFFSEAERLHVVLCWAREEVVFS